MWTTQGFSSFVWSDPVYKYPGLTPIFCSGSRALIMASAPDQSNELSVLDGNDGGISSDSPQDIQRG